MKQHLSQMLDALIKDDEKGAEVAFQQYMVSKTQEQLKPEQEEARQEITEARGERIQTYSAWRRACKQKAPDVRFDGDKDICNASVWKDGKPIKAVGEWDGEKGYVS